MTTGKTHWRESFAQLALGICHARKLPDKAITDAAPDKPLRFEFAIDGVAFEAVHPAPAPDDPARFQLRARFGKLPATGADWHCEQALKTNHVLARAHGSMITIDPEAGEFVYSSHFRLEPLGDAAFLKGLGEIAQGVLAWRRLAPHAGTPATSAPPAAGKAVPVMPLEAGSGTPPCPHRDKLLQLLRDLPTGHGLEWRKDQLLPEHIDAPRVELALHFGSQQFTLVHSSEPSIAELCLIECRFGTAPPDRAGASHRRLLELNHELASVRTSAFSIDPVSGQVVHGLPIRLPGTSTESLFGVMDMLAELALSWRHDQYLAAPPSTRGPARQAAGAAR